MNNPNTLPLAQEVDETVQRGKQRKCDRCRCSEHESLLFKLVEPVPRLGKFVGLLAVMLGVVGNLNAQLYWNTNGVSGNWTDSNWGSSSSGPFSAAYTNGNNTIFTANSTVNTRTASVGNITVNSNVIVSLPAGAAATGTFGTGGNVRTFDVGVGGVLDFAIASTRWSTATGTGIIKEGQGILKLIGKSEWVGGFTLNNGTIIVSGNNTMGGGITNTLKVNGGTIAADATVYLTGKYGNGITIGGNFTLGAVTTGVTSGNSSATANITFSDNVSLGASTRIITIGANGTYTLGGVISTNGTAGLTINATSGATGTLVLGGANTYNGTTTLNGGTLSLNSTNALQNSTLNTGAAGSQVVNFIVAGANTYNLGGLAGADNLSLGANSISVGSNNADTTYSAVIISTGGGLTKVGTGALTLSGANTYTGTTTVNSGTLALGSAGSIASSSVLKIASGATFDVKAKSAGFTLNTPLTIDVDVANAGKLDATGVAFTYGGNLTLNITTSTPFSYDLFDYTSGSFTGNITLGGLYSGNMTNSSGVWTASSNGYDFTFSESNGVLSAATAAIPEPGSWVLVGIAAIFFLYRMRRKDASSSGHN